MWVQGNWQEGVSFRRSYVTIVDCGAHGTGHSSFTLYVVYPTFDDFFIPTSSL